MIRKATFKISTTSENPRKRIALSTKDQNERIAIDDSKLWLTLDALHWNQRKPATPKERALYGVSEVYAGNDNGDLFEGKDNIIWACRNPDCTNKLDHLHEKGTFRFLKYAGKDVCPHCKSPEIYDWEKETFGTVGELLAKNQDGNYRFETWKGEPVNVNHDDERRVGKIEDVWIDPPREAVVELISLDKVGPHNNDVLCRKIEAGLVDSGSMELLTGHGSCTLCQHVHHSEEDFCDCLKNMKGMVDQRTGIHVAEICKNIAGCGHAIIATGDPADSGALVRQVLAGKKEDQQPVSTGTNFNHDMAQEKVNTLDAKPVVEKKASRKPNLERVGRRSEGQSSSSYSEKPLPDMSDMAAQLKAFGNYDGTRTAQDIRLASMSPEERAEYEEFQAFRQGKKVKASPSISLKPTLRVDKKFIMASLRSAMGTKKMDGKAVFASLSSLTLDKEDFTKALASRRLSSNALARLSMRRGQLVNTDELEETIMDVIADSLISAGESMKSQVSDTTYDDVFDGASDLSEGGEESFMDELGKPEDESEEHKNKNDIPLDKGLPKEEGEKEEDEPTVIHNDEDKKDFKPEEKQENEDKESSDSLEEKPMKNETKKEAQKTETFPEAKAYTPEKSPSQKAIKTEDEPSVKHESNPAPKVSTTLKIALQRRAQALETSIEKGEGNLEELVSEHTKVTAQLGKLDDLGGNGMDENAKPVDHVGSGKKLSGEEGNDKPESLGGNGLDENPKPVIHVAAREAWQRIKASITNPSAVSAKDIAMLKEMGILPKDYKAGQALPKATSLDTEDPPTEATDATGDLKLASKADDKMIENENVEKKTAPGEGSKDEESNKGWNDKTKPGEGLKGEEENKGWTKPTGNKDGDAEMAKETGQVEGKELSTKVKADDAKQDKDLGRTNVTKPGEAIKDEPKNLGWERTAQLKAEYSEPTEPGSRSNAAWTVFANDEPILRVALRNVYPGEVIKRVAQFASEEYAATLVDAIQEQGVEAVHNDTFSGQTKLFTPAERTAMRKAQAAPIPAATNVPIGAPASVEPAVADKILNDAKPGIGVLDLVASLIAPVIAESDSLSVSSFMEDLVGIGQNQDKVTELTTKLNSNVETIKSQAGLPENANTAATPEAGGTEGTEGAPGPVATPPAASPNPQVVQAMKPISEAEKRWALKLQASRIEPIVLEEQACGLIPGATQLHAEGLSRKASSQKAREVVQTRVAELMALPEEAYLMVEREIKAMCRKVKAERNAKLDPKTEERKARWAQLKSEVGGVMTDGMDGGAIEANSNIKSETKVPLTFTSAGGITREGLKKAMELRDNRGTRRD